MLEEQNQDPGSCGGESPLKPYPRVATIIFLFVLIAASFLIYYFYPEISSHLRTTQFPGSPFVQPP